MSARVFTSWSGPPQALRKPREGSLAATVDVRCHVAGCEAAGTWWRPVGSGAGALGACLCDEHVHGFLVSWSMPPYPPEVVLADQMSLENG